MAARHGKAWTLLGLLAMNIIPVLKSLVGQFGAKGAT